ncbi:MAG: hypothetical protein KF873_14785 [Gemmataceae bacterium]|nr:hypothetical protein [Planctomycetia bacterium]MBX3400004.1 hypothetical protein [Gemmataceae bacterium]
MWEFLFELLFETTTTATGHVLVYCLTLGQVRCSDGTAQIIGIVFWILVLLTIVYFVAR